ncbi:MAG: PAS domain S-box protein, partial [Acidobacteriota bacterium]
MKKLFGTRIKALRRKAGLTQAELAAQAGISDRFLGRLERGLAAPSFESLGQLARTLGVDPGELFTPPEEADSARRNPRQAVKSRSPRPGTAEAAPAPAQPLGTEAMVQAGMLRDFGGMTLKCVDQNLRLLWVLSSDPTMQDFQQSLPSRPCYSQIHGLDAPCPGCQLPEAIRTGRPQGGEVTTPEGRTFITRSTPVPSPDSGPAWAVHMAFEITERKHMEEALRRTQARLEHLLASSPMVLRTCSPDAPFSPTYVSENMRDIFGHAQLDLLGSSFWLSQVHPADAKRVRQAQDGLAARGRLVQDYRVRNGEGVWRWVRDDQRLVTDCEGRHLEIVGAWQDITDSKASEIVLRSSESRYRDLFLTNSTVQLLIDGDTGAILDANPAAQAFYGYPCGELRSMNIADINTLEL